MKKNKVIKYLFISMILILCVNIIYTSDINEIGINKIFNELSNDNLDAISDKKYVLNLVESIKKDCNNKKIIGKAYYIEAYVKYSEKKYDSSVNKLNQGLLKLNDSKKYSDVRFAMLKLKYLNFIKLKDIKNVEETFSQILTLTDEYNLYSEFIELCTNHSNQLLQLDDGTNMASKMIDEGTFLLNRIKNNEDRVNFLNTASNIYMFKDQLDISLKYSMEALDLCIKNDLDDELRVSILVNMSANYILQESYEDAIGIIEYILEFEELNSIFELDILSYMSVAYVECEKYDEAENTLNILMKKIENDNTIGENLKEANRIWIYTGYADLYTKKGEYEKSKNYLKKLDDIYAKYKDISFSDSDINILIEHGDLYYKLGKYEEALKYHEEAYDLFKFRNIDKGLSTILEAISDDYYKLGEYEKSYNTLKDINKIYHKELRKINHEKSNNIYNTILLEDKNAKIDELNRNKIIMKSIILVLVIITIMGYINIKIVRNKKDKIKKLNDKLQKQTLKDSLTGLYNRKGLREYIENFSYTDGLSEKYAFFMLDVDCFKLYNDNYGHIKGDDVLTKVSNCLKNVASEHFVARYGGEEFLIIMKYDCEDEIEKIATELQDSISKMNIEHKYSFVSNQVTLSIGSCNGQFKKEEISKIINQADVALYNSKLNGRNRYTNIKFKNSSN